MRRLLGAEAPLQLAHRVLITRYYEALGRYRAPLYQGAFHLFVAEEWGLEPDERLPDGVQVQTSPATTMRSWKAPGLLELTVHLRRALDHADQAARISVRSAGLSASSG